MQKFNIGDRVKNKLMGPSFVGEILEVVSGKHYATVMKEEGYKRPNRMDELYPDWESKPVYHIKLLHPMKHLSKNEYDTICTKEEKKYYSYENLPMVHWFGCVEDDLEME